MSMGIGTNARKPDEGKLKRDSLCEIACGVWFTSTGTAMPKMIKYQDDEGMIRSIGQIHVQTREKKYYCGIPIHEYRCSTVAQGQEHLFRLYYYAEENRWKLSWESGS